jgi:urocanate hydratase
MIDLWKAGLTTLEYINNIRQAAVLPAKTG